MKKQIIILALAFIAIILISWGGTGHKTVAKIAENHLTLNTKGAVKALLGDQSMSDVASWADQLRNDPSYSNTGSWHYINAPLGLSFEEFSKTVKAQGPANVYGALLKCEEYKFKPEAADQHFYYIRIDGELIPIETGICRSIVNANKLKTTEDISRLAEKIIFPYQLNGPLTVIIPEAEMLNEYPNALQYLNGKRAALATRDKGQRTYETWYAYGRRQSMDINAFKLFFPHICEKPSFVICDDLELLFYNGIAVVSNDLMELQLLKRILESEIFYQYIKNTTKDYSSGYISMSRNYLKNFGIPDLTDQQKEELLETDNVNDYLAGLYELNNELIPIG